MRSFDPQGMVIVDRLGCEAVLLVPAQQEAVVLDIGGRVNKTERQIEVRLGLSPGQTAELIANLTVAAMSAEPEFAHEVEEAIEREIARLRAIDEEHREQ